MEKIAQQTGHDGMPFALAAIVYSGTIVGSMPLTTHTIL